MSTQFNLHNNHLESNNTQGKVRVTDLLSRMHEEKKLRKKEIWLSVLQQYLQLQYSG